MLLFSHIVYKIVSTLSIIDVDEHVLKAKITL